MLQRQRQRILTPVNETAASKHAFRWACGYARRSNAELLALYVFEIPMEFPVESRQGRGDIEEGEEILGQIEKIAEAERCRVSARMIAARNAGPAIVLEAGTRQVDLLVLGTPYHRSPAAVAVGSTADFVLKNAHCQVVLSREPVPQPGRKQD
jgi:nucleotide-binding universal stress UspA family protein